MNYLELKDAIIKEIDDCMNKTNSEELDKAVDTISKAKTIFVAGAGRTGLVSSEFVMRLMHIGFNVYRVGEVVTPAIQEDDLLIVCSGSGKTKSIINLVEVAKNAKAKVLLFTTQSESLIAKEADNVVTIHAKAAKSDDGSIKSIQPLSNLFAQTLILTFDIIIIKLMEKLNINEDNLKNKHTNLE